MDPAFVTPALATGRSAFLGRSGVATCVSVRLPCAAARGAVRMIGEGGAPDQADGVDKVLKEIGNPLETMEMDGSVEEEFSLEAIADDDLADVEVLHELSPPQPYLNAQAIREAQLKFRRDEQDTGSPEFQIATLTAKITYLTIHLKEHSKDHASTRGLLKMVATRTKLLKYLRRKDSDRFDAIISGLNIRISQQLRRLGE